MLTDTNRGIDLTVAADARIAAGIRAVLEPSSILLIGLGGAILLGIGRSRLRSTAAG